MFPSHDRGAAAGGAVGAMVRFQDTMRASPTITTYNPSAANAQIRNLTVSQNWSGTTIQEANVNGFYLTGTTSAGSGSGNVSAIHWTADSRLAVV